MDGDSEPEERRLLDEVTELLEKTTNNRWDNDEDADMQKTGSNERLEGLDTLKRKREVQSGEDIRESSAKRKVLRPYLYLLIYLPHY